MLTSAEKLRAISLRSLDTGISYGNLVNQYTEAEIEAIYREYEIILDQRRQAEIQRLRKGNRHLTKKESQEVET